MNNTASSASQYHAVPQAADLKGGGPRYLLRTPKSLNLRTGGQRPPLQFIVFIHLNRDTTGASVVACMHCQEKCMYMENTSTFSVIHTGHILPNDSGMS